VLTVTRQSTQISASGAEEMPASKKELSECPVDATIGLISGRWKGTILWRLQKGPKRTSELKRLIPQITESMLIRHLQKLVADGMIEKDDKAFPRRVYYSLSTTGRTLSPIIAMMYRWGRSHLDLCQQKDDPAGIT
jgi:DNA-binding HxlR family transcriptional regulator